MQLNNSQDLDFLLDFWKQNYLQEYINVGGSKIKFLTGRPGSGKTYALNAFCRTAENLGYVTVSFSARHVGLSDFRDIYLEILRQTDIETRLKECAEQQIRKMGYDPEEIPADRTFVDWLASRNEGDMLTNRAIRENLRTMFLKNPLLDYNFATVCSILTAGYLGHPSLDEASRQLLLAWMSGDKTIKAASLRAMGLAPNKITKRNARHMLRSLAELIHLSGHAGLLVTIDDLDILMDNSGLEEIHYTKMKRDDTYESIRELIDDIDSMHYIMFVFGFDRCLIDNEKLGFKSYQALWMRIQNEVVAARFNRFTDIADLDHLAKEVYSVDYIQELSIHFGEEMEHRGESFDLLDEAQAKQVLEQSEYGAYGIMNLIQKAMTGKGGTEHV